MARYSLSTRRWSSRSCRSRCWCECQERDDAAASIHPSSLSPHPLQSRPFMPLVRIKELPQHLGEKVTVNGWLYNKRSSGKLQFPIIRDGSGYLQCVVFRKDVGEETWKAVEDVTQESTVRVTGTVRAEQRAPGGVEMGVESFDVADLAQEYPITPKEHGTAFLMDLRH